MPTFSRFSDAVSQVNRPDESELAKMEQRLPPLSSVIAGLVDLPGFRAMKRDENAESTTT
jgi:hypothetical protein